MHVERVPEMRSPLHGARSVRSGKADWTEEEVSRDGIRHDTRSANMAALNNSSIIASFSDNGILMRFPALGLIPKIQDCNSSEEDFRS